MFDLYFRIGKPFPSGKSMFLKWPFSNNNKRRLNPVVPTHTLVSSLRIKDRFYYLRKLTNDICYYLTVSTVTIFGFYLPSNHYHQLGNCTLYSFEEHSPLSAHAFQVELTGAPNHKTRIWPLSDQLQSDSLWLQWLFSDHHMIQTGQWEPAMALLLVGSLA